MNGTRCKAAVSLLISATMFGVCIFGLWEYSAKIRWHPLDEMQFPGPGNSKNFPIMSASGRFRVDVQLPMSKDELFQGRTNGLSLDQQIPCDLVFKLYANNIQVDALTVSRLTQYGAFFGGQMDCYDGGTITIPKSGHYILKVQNLGDNPRISSGLLSLTRQENTENAAVLSGIFEVLAVISGITMLLTIFMNPAKRTFVFAGLLSFMFLANGCGTLVGHAKIRPGFPNPIAGAKYYRGNQLDIWALKNGEGLDPADGLSAIFYLMLVADLPVSCAADTLCLPIDKHLKPATETLP